MPDIPSKIFDRPLRNMSGNTTDERVLQAIQLVKARSDLWAKFTEHEKMDEGFGDIAGELAKLLAREMNATTMDCIDLFFEIRKEVRRKA
jgi:pyruvoyl-dependent arginine decarboxylase (PvlArgDC)